MDYPEKIDDLSAEILTELYRRHIIHKDESHDFGGAIYLLAFLRKTPPPQRDIRDLTVSSYLRLTRTDNQILLEEIAIAVGASREDLIKLESNTTLPWHSEPRLMANLACLYRINLPTLKMLSSNSLNIGYFSERINDRLKDTEAMNQWLCAVQDELEARGASDLTK